MAILGLFPLSFYGHMAANQSFELGLNKFEISLCTGQGVLMTSALQPVVIVQVKAHLNVSSALLKVPPLHVKEASRNLGGTFAPQGAGILLESRVFSGFNRLVAFSC